MSPDNQFESLQQAFQELWRRERAPLIASSGAVVARLRALRAATTSSTDWDQELEALSRLAESAANSMLQTDASDTAASAHSVLLWAMTFELFLHPSEEGLATFRALARHSWILEHSMTRLILAAMHEGSATRDLWIVLVKARLPKPTRPADANGHSRDLTTWGDVFLPNLSHAPVDELTTPVAILFQEDSAFLFEYLESFADWGLVEHALILSGAVATFDKWQTALCHSATAFDTTGQWGRSFIVLLLLKRAQDDLLLEPGEQLFGKSQTEDVWALEALIAEVRKRSDWITLLRCWSVAIFRSYIALNDSAASQNNQRAARKQARLIQILESMPDEIRLTRPTGPPPVGYPAWFAWYERGLECRWHLHMGGNAVPTEQVLDLYREAVTWETDVSKQVRYHHAQIVFGRQELIVGTLDLHLGATLASAVDTVASWDALWHRTLSLREVVEFGSVGNDDSDAWLDRSASSSLTELVIRLGIAAVETIAQSASQAPAQDGAKLASLLTLIQESVIEMASIEVLRADVWTHALRYLLLLWGRVRSAPAEHATFDVPQQTEHERQLIQYLWTDPTELLRALTACSDNGIQDDVLTAQLSLTSQDFEASFAQAKRLSQMSRPGRGLSAASLALGTRLAAALAAN